MSTVQLAGDAQHQAELDSDALITKLSQNLPLSALQRAALISLVSERTEIASDRVRGVEFLSMLDKFAEAARELAKDFPKTQKDAPVQKQREFEDKQDELIARIESLRVHEDLGLSKNEFALQVELPYRRLESRCYRQKTMIQHNRRNNSRPNQRKEYVIQRWNEEKEDWGSRIKFAEKMVRELDKNFAGKPVKAGTVRKWISGS